VLDAVRIAGRWVSQIVLDRLTSRSSTSNPPCRRDLVKQFCRATGWVNRAGELCTGSANVALKRLEEQGRVRLTPAQPRAARKQVRQLIDDGQPLPPLPALPPSVDRIGHLGFQLLSDAKDPNHLLWNRLIIRQHPLKAAPLVGAQLRYLIVCEEGIIGAMGFGPAAFHLECRDRWIGWDRQAQQENRSEVIGLSRFLIRPGLRCANLASRCYGLVLSRVAPDWQQRYGVKPVLVETYVDRSTYTGVSLSAANWRRLGSSRGRGRSSPSAKVQPKTPKDVWVYELSRKARPQLQQRKCPEIVVPRSIFQGPSSRNWVEEELDGLNLGDARLDLRLVQMLTARWQHPQRSFAASFPTAAQGKAAYRLIESSQAGVCFTSLLAPHHRQTRRRMAAESVVVLAQDTTTLSYNTLHQTQGLGPVGASCYPSRGLWLHSLHAYRLDRIALGCAWAQRWARPLQSDTAQRNEQSVADKESGRWMDAYQAAVGMARSMPQTHLVVCGDRESDIFELYDQAQGAPKNLHLLVRAQHDRLLESGNKLWDELSRQPLGGSMRVQVPRHKNYPTRTATLELKWTHLEIAAPRVALKKSWTPLKLYALMAREIDPPAGVEPIEWVLITDWKIQSLKMARRLVRWYGLRWGIECWHQVLKDVCGVETRQMKSAQALERALVLDMIVAWRAQTLCRLGKESPNLPASLYYSQQELAVLEVYKKKLPQHVSSEQSTPVAEPALPKEPPEESRQLSSRKEAPMAGEAVARSTLSLVQANMLVAMLGGFWGRKADGHPGAELLGRGLELLAALVHYTEISRPVAHRKRPPRKRPRKPG
jgi:hypothetical protein